MEQAVEEKVEPLCPVFGVCGGCAYQDLPYPRELALKKEQLLGIFNHELDLKGVVVDDVAASPEPYHYRNRLDLTLLRIRSGDIFLGFQPAYHRNVVQIDSCAISRPEISAFLPELKRQGIAKLPDNYRTANLVVRTGDDGRVAWGGIGRRSCRLSPDDYFWTEVRGKRIFYSLDTFFQANLAILPAVLSTLDRLIGPAEDATFFDLYAGVGLFAVGLSDKFSRVIMIEESSSSVDVARYNLEYHQLKHVELIEGRIEDTVDRALQAAAGTRRIGIVDPPRRGLSATARNSLKAMTDFEQLYYLSCNPESLARDLKEFVRSGWVLERIVPFDFFPKTKHLETLVKLCHQES
ncbi:MAG: hypothetical protein Q8R76_05705 [Candidatus Omnitrophota bacterium]|nr:hypothetical protein [Candidatus Omnitrophota bacterium]